MPHPNDPRSIKPTPADEPLFYVIYSPSLNAYMNEDNGFGLYAEAEHFDRPLAWLPDRDSRWVGPCTADDEP